MKNTRKPMAVFLDGPSASGKSSIKKALLNCKDLNLRYSTRLTTRDPRFDDEENQDYQFVSSTEFSQKVDNGELVEYRNFEFGMSYGTMHSEITKIHATGANSISLMNLGTINMVKRNYSDAICLIVICPLEDIERRLRNRKFHTEEQLKERLQNAETTITLAPK